MSDAQQNAVHLIVSGYVQGVGFRYYTRVHANRMGVRGWVRNNPDGTVEIEAEAPHTTLKEFIAAVRRGPSHGNVRAIDATWKTAEGHPAGFHIKY